MPDITRSSAMAEAPRDVLVKYTKKLNDLDIHPKSSQFLLLNGHMAYHFHFVDCSSTSLSRTVYKTSPLLK